MINPVYIPADHIRPFGESTVDEEVQNRQPVSRPEISYKTRRPSIGVVALIISVTALVLALTALIIASQITSSYISRDEAMQMFLSPSQGSATYITKIDANNNVTGY